ncbi:tripartite tricarboxylate transporter substrate binding protein [Corticibacter populi]|uniref:Tripartite tricarboxylate transporter substrate binding protein n=1 Tax=Corticibacter populi TaxID=1550736 RepID=A0A3M6QMP6_9BURK|nr:tripartite tricarboxylate transporter substrate binding protein [Corticibacter populi]RMX04350.1 tripartite tricarboxylate transporter substrate binding protein [Corticibacter populi]RZS33328.1 tripartite-type tricarboxylate transporter receptor subunit TctC [Corticibacter populi]
MTPFHLNRRRLMAGTLLAGLGAWLATPPAHGAEPFPSKPIQLIVPYGAGGPTDAHLRVVAQQASAVLGQPVIIDNKPGANGTFGAAALARAQPDGYTIAVLPASVYREPWLNRVAFDPLRLTYIIGMTDYTFGLAVRQDAPWQSWDDFAADVKKRPGKISVGAAGPVQTPNIVVNELMQLTGLDLNRVPYKGDSDQAADLLGGHIDAGVLSGVASSHIHSGRLRYLVMLTPERVPQFPDVPTLRELGVNAVVESPYGIAGPEGLSPEQVRILHDAFKTALESPEGRKILDQLNQPLNYRGPEAFAQYAKDAFAREKGRMEQLKASGALD